MTTPAPPDVLTPVHATPPDDGTKLEDGIALCLSGGGYRAMIFHVGVLWRLNEAKLLSKIKRFSSVSGGSITAGVLASRWDELKFDGGVAHNFVDVVVKPVRDMASTSVDLGAVFWGSVLPGSIADRVANAYREHLFERKTLQDLPDKPRFVFNATNLESGVLFRFSKPYMGDYRVGRIFDPTIELAVAVAASSAFPPVLSPCVLDLRRETWRDDEGNDLGHEQGFRDKIKLADGGVYDNLGLETAWKRYKTILVSDAGGHVEDDPDPDSDWLRQTARVLDLIDNQVRSLRKRQVIESFDIGGKDRRGRDGMYVGIRSEVANFPVSVLKADPNKTIKLAELGTRLYKLRKEEQERLINWGYIVCDAGLRSHVPEAELDDRPLPYPNEPLQ